MIDRSCPQAYFADMRCMRHGVTLIIVLALVGLTVTGCAQANKNRRANTQVADAAIHRGQSHLGAGQLEAALLAFEQALDANPRAVDAHVGIGDIYEVKGDYNTAARSYADAKRIDPGNFKAVYKLGLMYHLLDRVREAIREYLQSLAIDPNSFEANLNLATAYLQVDEPQLGLPYAVKATRLKPDSQPARVNLGSIYAALGQYNDAIDEFRAAAELGELEPEIALNLANAFLRTNRPMRALNTLLVLSKGKGANNAAVLERLGYTYFKLKEYDKSLEYYDKALAVDPNDSASLNGKGVNLMTMYLRSKRENISLRDQAIDAWQRSVKIQPNQRKIIDLIARYRKL